MFVLRCLFWFALVAVMMPRGPDLGLDLDRVRNDMAAHSQSITFEPADALSRALQWRVSAPSLSQDDPVQAFRDAVLSRLAVVRVDLARTAPEARVGDLAQQFSAHVPY